jgi:hypothetical protein
LAQGDRRADPVEEVLQGGLGHPVEQDPVDRPPQDLREVVGRREL